MVSVGAYKNLQYWKSRIYAEQSEAKILKKIIIFGHRSTILGPQFCKKKKLVLGPPILGSGEPGPLDPPLLLAIKHCQVQNIMFCKGGTKPKILDLFADLQHKMHYLNDVQDLWGCQSNVCGFLVVECKGEALEF